jgi:uncharacterized protein (DUF2235 family)
MGKNIVVCYDGTNKEYGRDNTNVVKTFETILRNEGQVAFYDPGVGTFSFLGRVLGRRLGILLGMAFGYGIRQNIEDGYEYLMNRYEPGDNVYIFGFSRGAYTARALAGMIHYFGIAQKGSKNLIPYVSKMYFRINRKKEYDIYRNFKKAFSHPCNPHFIGIWDTVAALGPNLSKRFPDLELNQDVRHGCHAIAIDERRKPYKVTLWDESKKKKEQEIEQVWFAGAHSDVGGGCANDERALSDIAFGWMMDKAHDCGLKLADNWQKDLRQDALGRMHNGWRLSWIIFGWPVSRKLPENIKIHQSVIDRINGTGEYRPALPEKFSTVSSESYTA